MTTPRRKHFDYLNGLRLGGKVNMFGAAPFLMREFDIGSKDALDIIAAWVKKHPNHVEEAKVKKEKKPKKKESGVWPFKKGKK